MPGRDLPSVTGPQLAKLLERDDWIPGRVARHGQLYSKWVGTRLLTTTIPLKNRSIPRGTLAAILGPQQTCLGKDGLRVLIEKYGLS
jgi:hypothetical protein